MLWADETFTPRVDIALISGYATETTCLVLAASLSNADANLNVNGTNYQITGATEWVEVGSDISAIPQATWESFPELGPYPAKAGYIYSFTVSGLSTFTKYNWTLTQTGSDTNTGSFMTKPADDGTDPFTLWFVGCHAGAGAASAIGWANGGFQTIAEYMKADVFPLVSVMHLDDYGYLCAQADDAFNDYAGGDADRTGLAQYDKYSGYAIGSGGEYMGAVAWFNYLNLTGYKNTVPTNWDSEIYNGGDKSIRSFSGEHCQYVMQNANFIRCPGDWEYSNDEGWDKDSQGDGLQKYQTGRHIQELFVEPLQPPHIVQNAGTDRVINPLNYDVTYGPVQIIAPDGIVNGTGGMAGSTSTDYTDPVTEMSLADMVYGPKQIDDVLTSFDNTKPFKILMMMYGIRYPITPFGAEISMGAQHALSDHVPHEYEPWFSESGNVVKSIMDNENTNGSVGKFMCMHGDMHLGMWHQHRRSSGGLLTELFDSLYVGTINTSGLHGYTQLVEDEGHDGTTLKNLFAKGGEWSSVRLDVRVDLDPIELHYYFYTEDSVKTPAAVFRQTADGATSALERIDDMSKTYKEAYDVDSTRDLRGDEIIGATKQDSGLEDTGLRLNELALFNDLRFSQAAQVVPSCVSSFSYKGIQPPLTLLSDQADRNMLLSSGAWSVNGDGSIFCPAGSVELSMSANLRAIDPIENTMFIAVVKLAGTGGALSLGGEKYYYYNNGFFFSNTNKCGITQVKNDPPGSSKYARFPAIGNPDVSDQVVAMGLYYDPIDQTKCKRFAVSFQGGVQVWHEDGPNEYGTLTMSGSWNIDDDFLAPTVASPWYGLYKMPTPDDLTTAGNMLIVREGLEWMQANPNRGVSSVLSAFT